MTTTTTGHRVPMTRPIADGITHGIKTGYTSHGCRCRPCTVAQTRYTKAWRNHVQQGRPSLLVDVQLVADHVQSLKDAGMTFSAITAAAGYTSRNALVSALSRTKVRRSTAERIMAVTPGSDPRDTRYVDPTGTTRRVQALMAIGWTSRDLAEKLGHRDHSTILDIANGRLPLIRALTATRISSLYDDLWRKPGPSSRTIVFAAKKGWVSALAWDDDTIDDPSASPEGYERKESKKHYRDDVLEDFEDTRGEHLGDVRLAAMRLGMSHSSLSQTLHRAVAEGMEVAFFNVYRSDRKEA